MNESLIKAMLRLSVIGIAVAAQSATAAAPAVDAAIDARATAGMRSAGVAKASTQAVRSLPPAVTPAVTSSLLFMRYRAFVGSDADTRSVIQGLRYGELISLGGEGTASLRFLPPTRPMGWGNIDQALNLSQRALAAVGIAQPAAADLKAALAGGRLVSPDGSSIAVRGVLTLRSQGMGWGEIAQAVDGPLAGVAGDGSRHAGREEGVTRPAAVDTRDRSQSERVRVTFAPPPANSPAATGIDVNAGQGVVTGGFMLGNGAGKPGTRAGVAGFGTGPRIDIDSSAQGLAGSLTQVK